MNEDDSKKPETRGGLTTIIAHIEAIIPPIGNYPCAICGCDVDLPGVCEDCNLKEAQTEHEHSVLALARWTIPPRFRWATFAEPDMLEKRISGGGGRIGAIADIQKLFGRHLPSGLVLRGSSGHGKTSLACAILRRLHDSGAVDAEYRVVERARRAFFVSAPGFVEAAMLANMRTSQMELTKRQRLMVSMVRTASVLVLDDLPAKPSKELVIAIQDRHDEGKPTFVTTWMTRESCTQSYGDGITRRLFERVVET